MLRALLIYLSQAGWARGLVQNWPLARKMAARFVAGESAGEAVEVVKSLNGKGIQATLDHLGEHVSERSGADQAVEEIFHLIRVISRSGVSSGISLKLSQIGLELGEDYCLQNLRKILSLAREKGLFVRIDMEESRVTEQTLRVFKNVARGGFEDQVGIVLQSYLYRTEDDLQKLMKSSRKVRLCKGAYKEPPAVAFPSKKDVDDNFDRLTAVMLDRSLEIESRISSDGIHPPLPALATHDLNRIEFAKEYAGKIGLGKQGLEFQMLYGIREDLQRSLVSEGYPVRVYVPYGTEWYPYFVRRLAERPANLWFFVSNFFRR